jgi:hypothetical protein
MKPIWQRVVEMGAEGGEMGALELKQIWEAFGFR